MPRKRRLEFNNAFFHIMSRGVDKRPIFFDNRDKYKFVEILEETNKEFEIKIYAYCLMDNHYHLLLEILEQCLSEVMHKINSNYVKYFNKKRERVGHLFSSRFKSILVEKDSYLMELTRYIHLNPVKAGIVKKPEDYYWSSYKDYIQQRENTWLQQNWIIDLFGPEKKIAYKRYKYFISQGLKLKDWDPIKKSGSIGIIGSPDFINKYKNVT